MRTQRQKVFISMLLVLTIVMSFIVPLTHTVKADAAGIILTNGDKLSEVNPLKYYNPVPDFGTPGTLQLLTDSNYRTYTIDDIIIGYVTGLPAGVSNGTIEIRKTDGTVVTNNNIAISGNKGYFSIVADVPQDGLYNLVAVIDGSDYASVPIFVKYTLRIDDFNLLQNSSGSIPIDGWVLRGSGEHTVSASIPLDVYVIYPDNTLAGYCHVPANSGQFAVSIAVPQNDPNYIGIYRIVIKDGYDTINIDNDAIVYAEQTNVPQDFQIKVSTLINPTKIYKEQFGQLFDIIVTDNKGNPYDVDESDIDVSYSDGTTVVHTVQKVSKGVFLIDVNTMSCGYRGALRIQVNHIFNGDYTMKSNVLYIPLEEKGIFNPYVYAVTDNHQPVEYSGSGPYFDPSLGRDVYGELPCRIGTSFRVIAGYYPQGNDYPYTDWLIHKAQAVFEGPAEENYTGPNSNNGKTTINMLTNPVSQLQTVISPGQFSVTINMEVWERANKHSEWETGREQYNACCHKYTQTFDICKTDGCKVNIAEDSVKLKDFTNIHIKLSDYNGFSCGCCDTILHIYMVDNSGNKLTDAFTISDNGYETKYDDIWYSTYEGDTNIDTLPIDIHETNDYFNIVYNCDNSTLTVKNIAVNYSTDCGNNIVVQVFTKVNRVDVFGNFVTEYPLVYERANPFSVTSVENQDINYSVDGTDKALAGVSQDIIIPIDQNNLQFEVKFADNNGNLEDVLFYKEMNEDNQYVIHLIHPISQEGSIYIYAKHYDEDGCLDFKGKAVIPVILPEFTVTDTLYCGATIDADGTITEGIPEMFTVSVTDPREKVDINSIHWGLEAQPEYTDCDIPEAYVCYNNEDSCANLEKHQIRVTAYANDFVSNNNIYIVFVNNGTKVKAYKLTIEPVVINIDPTIIETHSQSDPVHITFTVKDAHNYGLPGIQVKIDNTVSNSSYSNGYGWISVNGLTNKKGEVGWNFVPTYFGQYKAIADMPEQECDVPLAWDLTNNYAVFEVQYKPLPLDTEAPVIIITVPEDNAIVNTNMVRIKGTVTDNTGVTSLYIGSQKIDFAPDGSFSATVELAEGENTIKVFAFDIAGNKAEKDIIVTYEKPVPVKKTVITIQIGSDVMTVNGQVRQLDVVPVIHNGHTYLPLRAIAEALGAKVNWIAETKGITLTLNGHRVDLQIGNSTAVMDGETVTIFPPYLQSYGNGTYAVTMVPLRVIAEGLGAEVTWEPITKTVTVTVLNN